MVELFFNRIILQIQHMTPDCTRQRAPMFFFQRRVTRKTISLRATEICAFIAKKTKTNPRVKASKSERYWRGPLFDCVKFRALLRDKETELSYEQEHLDYCQRVMCVCVHVHYSGTCVLQCVDCCFIGCELSSGNLISMLCIPLEFLLFFFVIHYNYVYYSCV